MRVAFAGKGGAGKTTLAAAAARLLARRGRSVVAIDADTNPNLATALGADAAAVAGTPMLSPSMVSRRLDGPALSVPLEEALSTLSTLCPDGVRLVRMGMPQHADEGCLCSAHAAASALLADLGRAPGTVTVMDLEASPEHLSRGTARHADLLLLVAEPYFRSIEAARRQAELARELPSTRVAIVANKVRDDTDAAAIAELAARLGLEMIGVVPSGEEVLGADRAARALVDVAPNGPVVQAIDRLASAIVGGAA